MQHLLSDRGQHAHERLSTQILQHHCDIRDGRRFFQETGRGAQNTYGIVWNPYKRVKEIVCHVRASEQVGIRQRTIIRVPDYRKIPPEERCGGRH